MEFRGLCNIAAESLADPLMSPAMCCCPNLLRKSLVTKYHHLLANFSAGRDARCDSHLAVTGEADGGPHESEPTTRENTAADTAAVTWKRPSRVLARGSPQGAFRTCIAA